MEQIKCEKNIHPGCILKEEIEYRGLNKRELAKAMSITYKSLNDILNEKAPLTVDVAMLIEDILCIDTEPLIIMQNEYNIRALEENKKHVKLLEKLRSLSKHVAL